MAACGKYQAADLRHRVVVQAPVRSPDGQGGFTESWDSGQRAWASVDPIKGYERMQAMHLESPLTHKVTMRYRRDITRKHRLIFKDRVLHIKDCINVNEDGAFLQLLCVEMA